MTCERHVRRAESMRRTRLDREYRAKEQAYNTSDIRRERKRKSYAALNGYKYNKLLLQHRRTKALARMAKRHVPKVQGG